MEEVVLFSPFPLPGGSKQAINMEMLKLEKIVSVLHPADNVHRGCVTKWMGLSLHCTSVNFSRLSMAEPFTGPASFVLWTPGPLALLQTAQHRVTTAQWRCGFLHQGAPYGLNPYLVNQSKGRETMQLKGEGGSGREWRKSKNVKASQGVPTAGSQTLSCWRTGN